MDFGWSLFGTGVTKKENLTQTYSPTINAHQPFETFGYSPQIDWTYAPTIVWESAGANVTGSTVTTKKESSMTQEQGATTGATTEVSESMAEGSGWLIPALIIGTIGIGGYFLLKSNKNKNK